MIQMEPIGFVRAARQRPEDDFWGGSTAAIELADAFSPEALDGIETFSHAEVIFLFDQVDPHEVTRGARHPRGNAAWPKVGIFAQRAKNRPNRIGTSLVRILGREGRRLMVAELDAIDGTPVLDLKPVMRGFLPREPITEPDWAAELMADYWKPGR